MVRVKRPHCLCHPNYTLHLIVTGMFNYETWVFRLYVVFVTSTMRLLGLIEELFTTLYMSEQKYANH